MKLWLVRHAAPDLAAGICYGRLDVPADTAATRQAALALAAELPAGALIRSSPLQRCEQLAKAVCGLRPDSACETDPRLAEMDFGSWEGLAWDAVDPAALQAWTDRFEHYRPGGGEAVGELMQRVAAAWEDAARESRPTAWITHAGVIRAALLLAAGRRTVTAAADWPREEVPFGSCRVLDPEVPVGPGSR